MDLSAVYHISGDNYCYPLDENRLLIKLRTGADIDRAELVWGDPFDAGLFGSDSGWKGASIDMEQTARLSHHKIWESVVVPKFKRCRYYFILHSNGETYYYIENGFQDKKKFESYNGRRQDFFFPWMNPADIVKPAPWVSGTVWYQIFPDRFCSSGRNTGGKFRKWNAREAHVRHNYFYGGDLAGAAGKLDYLHDLGITGIYFTPVFESTSNHKYNTRDYEKIDPDFGTDDDMKNLVKEAHKRGIRVMLDGVFNHSGDDFAPWQDVLKNGRESKYFDWFMVNKFPMSKIGGKAHRGEYYSFAFVDSMPKLNTNNRDVQDYFISVVKNWVGKYDIDALRLDVADELSHDFNKRLRREIFAIKPDFYICGEVWHNSMAWLRGDEFDSVMNYSLQENIESFWRNPNFIAKDFEYGISDCFDRYTRQTCSVMFDLLDSHDTARLITRCGGDVNAFYQELCALFTLNGSVCFYYGTEIRLVGGHDPDCRRCMPWDEIERGDHDESIAEMKRLIKMRRTIPALCTGSLRFVDSGDPRVIVYDKSDDTSVYRVTLNCSGGDYTVISGDVIYSRGLFGNTLRDGGAAVIKIK